MRFKTIYKIMGCSDDYGFLEVYAYGKENRVLGYGGFQSRDKAIEALEIMEGFRVRACKELGDMLMAAEGSNFSFTVMEFYS